MRRLQPWGMGICLFVLVLTQSGCVPLLVGAAVGAGSYAWVKGQLVKDMDVPAERLHSAVSRAMRDLHLAVMEDHSDRLMARITAKFSDGTSAAVSIDAKTERTCTLKIRVGVLGDKDKSEMIYNSIKRRL